jgi:hypothetical protein
MKLIKVRRDILNWIENFVEQSNAKLNGWPPCPFARKARIENKVDVRLGTSIEVDLYTINDEWDDKFDVVIFAYDPNNYTPDEVSELVEKINYELLLPNDLMCLDDHPSDHEEVSGVRMNQGQYLLLMCQRFGKVNDASDELKRQGYYDLWTRDYYDRVVGWREQYGFDDN